MSEPASHGPSSHSPHGHAHPASMAMLVTIFASLLALTAVTVAVAYVDLGELNLLVAMGIATIKALLVAIFFMHLSHDTGFNRLAFFASFAFVGLFVTFTLMDTGQYQRELEWHERVLPAEEGALPPPAVPATKGPAAPPAGG